MIYTDNQARHVSAGTTPVSFRKKQRNAPLSAETTKIWALFENGYKCTRSDGQLFLLFWFYGHLCLLFQLRSEEQYKRQKNWTHAPKIGHKRKISDKDIWTKLSATAMMTWTFSVDGFNELLVKTTGQFEPLDRKTNKKYTGRSLN